MLTHFYFKQSGNTKTATQFKLITSQNFEWRRGRQVIPTWSGSIPSRKPLLYPPPKLTRSDSPRPDCPCNIKLSCKCPCLYQTKCYRKIDILWFILLNKHFSKVGNF